MLKSNLKYKVLHCNNEDYIYFCENGRIYKINNSISSYDLENNVFPLNYIPINCRETRLEDICKNVTIAEMVRELPGIVEGRSGIGHITLLVIQECNLRCTYCYGDYGSYGDSGYIDAETAIHIIDNIVLKSTLRKFSISFFGGEPLLNFPVIKEVVHYCEKIERDSGIRFVFGITSNGTLINSEMERFFMEHKIQVKISLDGDKEQNDKNRMNAKGQGSYDEVIDKTKKLRENGVLSVRATLMPGDMNLSKLYEHLFRLNFKGIYIAPAFNEFSGRDYDILTKQSIEWLCQMENHIQNGEYEYVLNNLNLINDLCKIDRACVRQAFCEALGDGCAVDIRGNIYPCHRFVYYKEFGVNSITEFEQRNRQMQLKLASERSEACKKCWAYNLCVCGCIYNNYAESGRFTEVNKNYCRYVKAVYEKELNIYISLSEEVRKLLCKRTVMNEAGNVN